MKSIIYVPQHCYAIITPETPPEYSGLCTGGLSRCTGLIASAKSEHGQYLLLCHADSNTNLTRCIKDWLNSISPCDNIKMFCSVYGNVEHIEVKKIVESFEGMDVSVLKIPRATTEIAVLRASVDSTSSSQGREISKIDEEYFEEETSEEKALRSAIQRDKKNDDELEGEVQVAEETELEETNIRIGGSVVFDLEDEGFFIEQSDFTYFVGQFIQSLPEYSIYPAICVFDSENLFSKDQILKKYPLVKQAFPDEAEENFSESDRDTDKGGRPAL